MTLESCIQRSARFLLVALTLSLAAGFCACTEPPQPQTSPDLRPLQPLVYTEQPALSPEASGVRERRMLRQYRQGATESGSWGEVVPANKSARPAIQDEHELGEAIFEALVERDESGWDALFVAPEEYAELVRVSLEDAREFVDDLQASSLGVWRGFEPGLASEAPDGGFKAVFEFAGLKLGEGRRVDGPVAREGETVAQHWGNTLQLSLRGSDLLFELKIPKILRLHTRGQAALSLGSPIKMSSLLETYIRVGLHLKSELLETREYPYPLAVGNFWRYQRTKHSSEEPAAATKAADKKSDAHMPQTGTDNPDEGLSAREPMGVANRDGVSGSLAATETLLEVVSVDRYGSRRLVTLRRSYNDEALSTRYQYFLLLPRRIYPCSARCRRHIKDLDWLLSYLDRVTPIYLFPLRLNEQWGVGGRLRSEASQANSTPSKSIFQVGGDWQDVRTPAGTYTNTVQIRGLGNMGASNPYQRGREQTRYFAHGHGLVQRVLRDKGAEGIGTVVEKLVESRIMPR